MQFKRSIGPTALWMTAVGGIVGSGWLFGSLYAAKIAGPAAILSWIIGGLLMIMIALTFAELGSAFPVAGGMARFAHASHGPLLSFTIGWMVWLSSVVVAPVETLAMVQYAANYIPGLVQKVANDHILTGMGTFACAVLMFLMCLLNWHGAKFFSRSSSVIVLIKLLVPILTIIALLGLSFHPQNFSHYSGFMPYGWKGVVAALPLGGVIYSFIGYSTVLQLAEETKRPQWSIPIAIIGALVFCIILYAILQTVFIGTLPASHLMEGWNQLDFPGDNGPFAGLLALFGMTWLVMIIYADAFISPFGTGFIYTAATARVSYGLSHIGFFPSWLQKLSKNGVPMRGIILNYLVGLILFLPFPGWQSMVSFIVSCFVIAYIIGPIALIGLRKAQPDHPRPFRLPFATFFALIAFYICNLLIFWTGWQTVSRLLIALLMGFIVFAIYGYRNRKMGANAHWQRAWWLIPYCLGLGIISYLGTFGQGLKIIPFGIDFVIIAFFTLIIFYAAIKSVDKTALRSWHTETNAV